MPNSFLYVFQNEYSYLQPVLHLYACMYMDFVPENKLIRIRILDVTLDRIIIVCPCRSAALLFVSGRHIVKVLLIFVL